MRSRPKVHVIVEPAKSPNIMTASVEVDGQPPFYLHSKYDPVREAQDWLAAIETSKHTLYVVLGFGLGYHVRELLAAIDDTCRVMVLEPFAENSLAHVAKTIYKDVSWLEDSRLKLNFYKIQRDAWVGISRELLDGQMCRATICPHFPTMQIYPEYFQELQKNLMFEINQAFEVSLGVKLYNNLFFHENAWRNIEQIAKSPGILSFRNKLQGVPAIIVGSGPSLQKNAHLLNECKKHALVIGCGTALKALHKQKVVPHIFACVDPFSANETLLPDLSAETMLLASYDAYHGLIAGYPGPKVFARTSSVSHLDPILSFLPPTDLLHRNVSVTTVALEFARFAGCNPIIFVGQDLAYSPENGRYASGVEQVFKHNPNQFTEVEGADGTQLVTPVDLRDVLVYIQEYIRIFPEISYINATEGGALIKGARHIALSEVMADVFPEREFYFSVDDSGGLDAAGKMRLVMDLETKRTDITALIAELQVKNVNVEDFLDWLEAFPAGKLIRHIITPQIMVCRFKAIENLGDTSGDAEAIRQKSLKWLDTLLGIISSAIEKLRQGDDRGGAVQL